MYHIIVEKYGLASKQESKMTRNPYGVGCWKATMDQLVPVKNGKSIEIGSGIHTCFWKDRWCTPRPLMIEAPTIYAFAGNKNALAPDYWGIDGEGSGWNIHLRRCLNDWEIDEISSLLGCLEFRSNQYQSRKG